MLIPPAKTDREGEARPPVVVVVPHPDDRELLRFGLALSHGERTRLRAWTYHRLGGDLHPALRIARYGMAARSEADRALRHLVEASSRGAHVPVRPFSSDTEERSAEERLIRSRAGSLLVVGRVRGRAGLQADAVKALAEAHRGPTVVLIGRIGPALREVLAVSSAPHEDAAHQALIHVLGALEQGYPVFRVRLPDAARLSGALDDAGDATLLIAAVDERGVFGRCTAKRPLWDRHSGPTALVFPPGDRLELLEGVLDRLTDDESPPPEPARAPPRWTRPAAPDAEDEMPGEAGRSSGQEIR